MEKKNLFIGGSPHLCSSAQPLQSCNANVPFNALSWENFRTPCSQKEEAVPALPQGHASHPLLLHLTLVFAELPWADGAQGSCRKLLFLFHSLSFELGSGCSNSWMNSCESSGGKGQARIASTNCALFPWIRLFIPHALPNPWPISKYLNAICN